MTKGFSVSIKVEGLDRALRGLDSVSVTRAVSQAVNITQEHMRKRISEAPPETSANQPKAFPGRWYERLRGPRYRRKDGSVGGRNTSEQLEKSWVRQMLGPLTQVLETRSPKTGRPVGYAALVQSEEQTALHRKTGWPTDEQVAQEACVNPRVGARIMAVIDKMLR